LPLLYSSVEDRQKELGIPRDVFDKLKKAYELNSARNTIVLEELSILARSFKEVGIPVTLLKGTGLLHTIFQDSIAIRRMDDIDILIKEEDIRKAARVLASSGYKLSEPFDLYNALGGPVRHKSVMYFKDDAGKGSALAPVHLHWHIVNLSSPFLALNWSKINMSEIWSSNASLGMDGGGNVLIMSPEHMLLALAEHGMSNGFARLSSIYDIHSYVTRYRHSLDWHRLAGIARSWELVVPLHVGLYLSRSMFNTYVSEDFFGVLRPRGLSSLEKHFIRYVEKNDFPKEDHAILLHLAVSRKLKDKMALLIKGMRSSLLKGRDK
jgi:hypothetical protein